MSFEIDRRSEKGTRIEFYLREIGVPERAAATAPFDPGYDPVTVESHLEQSAHLMEILKLSMACWQVAGEGATRRKIEAARRHGVGTVAGGSPFEVAVACGQIERYLDLCADLGFSRIECGSGFTDHGLHPPSIVRRAEERGLDVQYEVGKKHGGSFTPSMIPYLIEEGQRWLDAGARQLVIEGRENAQAVGLFDSRGRVDLESADRFAEAFGLGNVCFEAPVKASQFALLDHFGPEVHLSNVRLEELLRVEIYRRGLHSDAFGNSLLRPGIPEVGPLAAEGAFEVSVP